MNREIICPCCNNVVVINKSGEIISTFLIDKKPISQTELSSKYGIELGIVESEEKNESK